ncbi:hypothetical protein DFH27DRAFT_69480 [Peziza echinospora]|nr:hypothetical protein DFH27DRAFT_69480 [Peziza echinospora]
MALPVLLVSFMISALGWVFFTSFFFLIHFHIYFLCLHFCLFLEILFYYYDLLDHTFFSFFLQYFSCIYNLSFCTHAKFLPALDFKKSFGKRGLVRARKDQ